MRLFYTLLISFLILITNNVYSQSNVDLEQLTDSIESILKKEHIPGVFVTVVSKDSILYKRGIGLADIEQQIPVTSSHLFKIGSISKSFTALAIMQLVEDGKLSLDTKLADIAPEVPFENEWEASHPVRIKHLLEHKAGFDDSPISIFSDDRPKNATALDEVLVSKSALKSRWQPGLGFAYSNTGCTILAYIIEKLSNQRYQDYIKNEVLNPLQMHQTHFRSAFPDNLPLDQFATGYQFNDSTYEKSRDIKIICEGAGSILSNADDMSNFLQYLLNMKTENHKKIVTASTLLNMETLHGDLEVENYIQYGYGLGIWSMPYGTKKIPFYGHGGDINGFSSLYIYNRELDLGIAFSRTTMGSRKKITKLLVDTFTQDVEKANNKNNIDGTQLLDWEGDYNLLTSRGQFADILEFPIKTIRIEVGEDKVNLHKFLNSKKDVYVHQEGNAFTKRKYYTPNLYLIEKDGKRYMNYKGLIFKPINSFWLLTLRIILGLGVVLGIITTITILIQSIIAVFRKVRQPSFNRNVIMGLPLLSMLLPVILVFTFFSGEDISIIGEFNLLTTLIYFLTTIYPILTIWTTYWIAKNWNTISNRFLKAYCSLIVFSSVFLSVYFIYHGWFMKMMWI